MDLNRIILDHLGTGTDVLTVIGVLVLAAILVGALRFSVWPKKDRGKHDMYGP